MEMDQQIQIEIKSLIEKVGGKLENSEDVRIAFEWVNAQLAIDVARPKAQKATAVLKEHFHL